MKNTIFSCLTILLLVFASCEQDFIQDFDKIAEETEELQVRNGSDDSKTVLLDAETDTESSETEPTISEDSSTETELEATEITLTPEINLTPHVEDEEEDNTEFEIGPFIDMNKDPIVVGSLYLDCVSNSKFIIRATYDDQTRDLSLEYFDNSANASSTAPVNIDWSIYNEPQLIAAPQPTPQAGATAQSTNFSFDRDYNIKVSIEFNDNTTFTDEFCLNIGKANPSAFHVCSDHETTVGCMENSRGGNKKLLVIVDVAL